MFLRSTYPAFFWAAVILILCAMPGTYVPRLTFLDWLRPDKVVHLIMFGALSFLFIRGFVHQNTFQTLSIHPKMYAILFSIIYGIVIELLQQYIFIWRSGEVFDALADAIGAFIGLWTYNYYIKKKPAHS
jgi:glycopeptide antibiotics resistance protein